jgi:CheY-like chemotaxis protein
VTGAAFSGNEGYALTIESASPGDGRELRCVIVDDSPAFSVAARRLLEREGIAVVGVASTVAEGLDRSRALQPDVTLVDIDLDGESGFDLARRLAMATDLPSTNVILVSAQPPDDLVDLVAVSPALGFLAKSDLSAAAVRDLVADRAHGHGCRHEALVYSTTDELIAGTVPFIRRGLAAGEPVLAVLREEAWAPLREALDGDERRLDFVDAVEWHRSPERTAEAYLRYVRNHLAQGASRVRIIGQVTWPTASAVAVAEWKRFEAKLSVELASVPVSFVCAYDARELADDIVADALRTHPLLRCGERARPSAGFTEPCAFVRDLERRMPDLSRTRGARPARARAI